MTRPARLRVSDWPERLAALVEERRHTPFAWGEMDCVMLAGAGIEAVTGAHPFAQWRGAYDSEDAADAILALHDGLEAFVADALSAFGAPERAPAFAQRGDVGLILYGNITCLGVILGAKVAAPGVDGLQFVPTRRLVRAWAI